MAAARLLTMRFDRSKTPPGESVSLGGYTLDLLDEFRLILVDGYLPIKLTRLEYAFFRELLAQPRVLVSDRQLRDIINQIPLGTDVEYHMDNLRRKIRQSGVDGIQILRVRTCGYLLFPEPLATE